MREARTSATVALRTGTDAGCLEEAEGLVADALWHLRRLEDEELRELYARLERCYEDLGRARSQP